MMEALTTCPPRIGQMLGGASAAGLANKGLQPTRPALLAGRVGGTQPGVCVQVARRHRAAAILPETDEAGLAAEPSLR
jgi:hypothetical protein